MIPEKVYKASVKHIEHTIHTDTNKNLEKLLTDLAAWRNEKSNQYQDYDLYITDQYNTEIFGSRF